MKTQTIQAKQYQKEVKTAYSDGASIKANGTIKGDLETTIYDEGAYDGSINARASEILNQLAEPEPSIRKIYFNMQDNFLATQLETLHIVNLWLEGIKYVLRVTGIDATINARSKEWLIEIDVIKET